MYFTTLLFLTAAFIFMLLVSVCLWSLLFRLLNFFKKEKQNGKVKE